MRDKRNNNLLINKTENPCVGGSIPSRATKKAPIGAFLIIVKYRFNNSYPYHHHQILLDLY